MQDFFETFFIALMGGSGAVLLLAVLEWFADRVSARRQVRGNQALEEVSAARPAVVLDEDDFPL